MSKDVVAIIPSRYESSRFPGKPLALIHGKPMIQWVYERVKQVPFLSNVYVATDDERIFKKVLEFGGKAVMTSANHDTGTDRLAEAVLKIEDRADIILNIQGDEPMIKLAMIEDLAKPLLETDAYAATLKKEITEENEINNPNIAKVITDKDNNAIYFSRSTIPFNRDGNKDVRYYKHVGVYAFTREFLLTFVDLPQSILENSEKLEQLRIIENGYRIKVVETKLQSIGVDLPEHIAVVEKEMIKEGIV